MMAAMLKLGAPAPAPSTQQVANGGGASDTDDGSSFAAELEAQTPPAEANAQAAERADAGEQPPPDCDDPAADPHAPDEAALNDVLAALALLPGSPFAQATPAAQAAQSADAGAAVQGLAARTLAALAGAPQPAAAANDAAASAVQTLAAIPAQPAAGIALAGMALQPAAADETVLVAELAALRGDGAASGELLGDGASEGGIEFRLPDSASSARPAAAKASPLDVPLSIVQQRDGEFAEGVASRVQWMSEQKIGRAELRLNPAELGAIDVNLQLEGKQVRAEFSSASADVRQLLESGIPKLREMFSQQGLQLAHSHVGQQQSQAQQQSGHAGGGDHPGGRSDGSGGVSEIVDAPVRVRAPLGMLDEFA